MTISFVSAFAGIGGFERGFDLAGGFECISQIEWKKDRTRVLEERWPLVPRFGDIKEVTGADIISAGGRPDVVVGGFPCQDTSIAAPHRVGLEGERSGHFWSFARLLAELADLLDELDPRVVVIENVPGLLRSNDGADMDRVLATMVELGYGVAWRCLDSASIGGGQRRQRLLVVGHRGDDPVPAAQVLALAGRGSEDSGLDHPRRPSARRPKVARSAEEYGGRLMFRKSRRPRSKTDYATYIQDDVINTLNGFDTGFSSRQTNLVIDQGKVRVLTLEEWEAAQGFDAGWTAPMDKDGLRFSAIGDSMNVHLARWLGERIAGVFHSLPMIGAPA